MTDQTGFTTLTDEQLEALLRRVAQDAAREAVRDGTREALQQALKEVGLGDEGAFGDVRDLRTLLASFRAAKRIVWHQTVRMITTLVLLAMAAGLALMTWAGIDTRPK